MQTTNVPKTVLLQQIKSHIPFSKAGHSQSQALLYGLLGKILKFTPVQAYRGHIGGTHEHRSDKRDTQRSLELHRNNEDHKYTSSANTGKSHVKGSSTAIG